ncbi:MAG TPA: ATP-binding protein [Actinomycetota bacterium]|nr:ATP-binding protein [Actinomycetota bacterium]
MRLEMRVTIWLTALLVAATALHLVGMATGAYSFVFMTVPLVLGIVLSVWAVRRTVLKPLAQICTAARDLGAGDLSVRLPDFDSAELEEVSRTFNETARMLEDRAADLAEAITRLRSDLEGLEEIQGVLASGAGLPQVLSRVARTLGTALGANGAAIWRVGSDVPEVVEGGPLPPVEGLPGAAGGVPVTSHGALADVPEDAPLSWALAPARRDGRVVGVVGAAWDPSRPIDRMQRDLLVALAGLTAVAIENVHLLDRVTEKEQSLEGLLRKTLSTQEEERRRISRELHDETSQVLSALMMNVDLLERHIEDREPAVDGSLARVEAVKGLAEEAARNLDKMMLELRPALLDELGLMPALRWHLTQASDLWGVPIRFEGRSVGRLADVVEVAAFRIVQESVSNCVRHATASVIDVRVCADDRMLHVEVDDDGVGFDTGPLPSLSRTGRAVGLVGMRERAELVGGSFHVTSSPGHGTRVRAELPLLPPGWRNDE